MMLAGSLCGCHAQNITERYFDSETAFALVENELSFDAAILGCEALKLTLARISSTEDNEFIKDLASSVSGNKWIGNYEQNDSS